MTLGDTRVALINYLVASAHQGSFFIRIDNIAQNKYYDENISQILNELAWLGLPYQEKPVFQSERRALYEEQLQELILSQRAYRCFCSPEVLEENHRKQLSYGQPPRYERTCLHLSDDKIKAKIAAGIPFIWRFKLNEYQMFECQDMSKGSVTFDMKHFSDFALTRSDGSFMPILASFVDDWNMGITHIIRGEDQLSKTAQQAALYDAFAAPLPLFWHLPIISNAFGQPLSSIDHGFWLKELKNAGFLPHAICNYAASLCFSFEPEFRALDELIDALKKAHIHTSSSVKFDQEKLTWFNHKWLQIISPDELAYYLAPFIHERFPESSTLETQKIHQLIRIIQPSLRTSHDVGHLLTFYFSDPATSRITFNGIFGYEKAKLASALIEKHKNLIGKTEAFLSNIKNDALAVGLDHDDIFSALRYLMVGALQGIAIQEILQVLEPEKILRRLDNGLGK